MNILDLSHPLQNGMPVYPGTEPPVIRDLFTIEKDGFNEKGLEIVTHLGTHIDAAAHMLKNGKTLDEYSLDRFAGPGIKVDVSAEEVKEIEIHHLENVLLSNPQAEFLIIQTGWERFWGGDKYFMNFPVLSSRAAEWIAGRGLKGIGFDAVSVDPVSAEEMKIHRILLKTEMVIIENLTNLKKLPSGVFEFFCTPLKIKDADGSPVRAFARW